MASMEHIVLGDGSTGLLGDGSAADPSIVDPSDSIVTMEAMHIHHVHASAAIDGIHCGVAMKRGNATPGRSMDAMHCKACGTICTLQTLQVIQLP